MAITRKPKAADASARVNVDELINRGGSSPGSKTAESADATTPVVLRIPTAMLNQIDARVKAQPIKTLATGGCWRLFTRNSPATRNSKNTAVLI